jgi:uncharacterized membrane-anchored protein
MAKMVAFISVILILVIVNGSIYKKQQQLSQGRVVYLELAPIDPRSLMQGDYMALRYKIALEISNALAKTKKHSQSAHRFNFFEVNYVIIKRDENNIAGFKALYNKQAVADDELLLQYRVRNAVVKFASNAYFFEEGKASVYQGAHYGKFRVNAKGELLLVNLYDKNLKKLGTTRAK